MPEQVVGAVRRAYPRGCGGAVSTSVTIEPSVGLSPRVRGSLKSATDGPCTMGPIPAGAGEPAASEPGA